ncbi:SinI family autotransporter-associated protein [Budvicia aquatica]|uniref:Ornithine carbamoyltransferase n=1 Tax=Budvicia aquatica TaxID=82979 RepID=A0A2C6DRD5_9GAMM|nr:SinI family autotransporter-associated protein [Budvicia aquatica]PHI30882.1 ornithine carbamoyltransferase [Budvicia aquatica]VFS50753.1 Uncharacterised protein [Budvicia aquatica]
MKKSNTFTLKKLVLALALAGYTMSSAYAVMTSPTGTIQGTAPELIAQSNGAHQAIDIAHTTALVAGKVSTGDTITMTYDYADAEGDADDSMTHVTWYYTKGGVDTAILATNVNNASAATIGGTGTSVLTVPAAAAGATAIRVEITEYSVSGDPDVGTVINIPDVSAGGGGVGPFPPVGPIIPGSNVTPGIYASTDGTFTTNLIGTATNLKVGDTYVFKMWDTSTGAVGAGATDITNATYTWYLVGTSATDGISGNFNTNVSGGNFQIPINTTPVTGGTALTTSADGAQGFQLAVDY